MFKLAPMNRGLVDHRGKVIPWEKVEPGRYLLVREWPAHPVVAYARVSTDDQAKDGNSMCDQVQHAIKKAGELLQKLAALYVDPGLSASKISTDKRPGCRRLLEDIEAGRAQTVILYKRDRVARKIWQWVRFWDLCNECGAEILFTASKEQPSSKGPMGTLYETVTALIAEFEAISLSTRVADGLKAKIERGEFPGATVPYGYRRDSDSNLVPHPDHAIVVREIFRLAIREGLGAQRIAHELNRKYPNSCKGRAWETRYVARLLENPVYAGYYSKNGTLYRLGKVSPFLTDVEFQSLRSKIAARTRVTQKHNYRPKHQASPYLLKGLLLCGACGALLGGRCTGNRHGEPRREYRCECSARVRLNRELVEQKVVELCSKRVAELSERSFQEVARKGLKARVKRIGDELEELKLRAEQAESAWQVVIGLAEQEGVAAAKTKYAQRIQDRSVQIDKLRLEIADKQSELEETREALDMDECYHQALLTWATQFDAAMSRERRVMLVEMVDKVIYTKGDNHLEVVFHPSSGSLGATTPGVVAEFTMAVSL